MLRLIVISAFLTLPLAAKADTSFTCSAEGVSAEVQVSADAATSVLKVAGEEVPALRPCLKFSHGNSRIPHDNRLGGKWRCPHGVAGDSLHYEVYPIVNKANGEANHVKVIRWDDRDASTVDLKDCK